MTSIFYRGLRELAKAREEFGPDAPLHWSVGPAARAAIFDGAASIAIVPTRRKALAVHGDVQFCGLPAFLDIVAGDKIALMLETPVAQWSCTETQEAA